MLSLTFKHRVVWILRLSTSVIFLLLGSVKIAVLFKFGLEPYREIVFVAGLPGIVKYYGLVAALVELYLAVGLWRSRHYFTAIILALIMTAAGSIISIALLVFKINSECGCGLLGDSEGWLLLQKGLILVGLIFLYKNKMILFDANAQT